MKRKRNMIRFDMQEILTSAIYTALFMMLLLIFGLDFRQSLSLGIILAQFYQILVKIHYRIRR